MHTYSMLNGYNVYQNSAFTGSIFTYVTLDFVSQENIMHIDFFLAVYNIYFLRRILNLWYHAHV